MAASHNLFVITGRRGRVGLQHLPARFRRGARGEQRGPSASPTPIFGLGLVEGVPDSGLIAAKAAGAGMQQSLGVGGHFNVNANDGTITRFGWKAQNKSLTMFAGEAYNVEQGVTNELFPNERESDQNCQFNVTPEDATLLRSQRCVKQPGLGLFVGHRQFRRLRPVVERARSRPGERHDAARRRALPPGRLPGLPYSSQTTGNSAYTGQSNVTFQPFSDFAVHDMGSGLADGITQGTATGNEFRTAPLWGLGQRIFLLHDGRTTDLDQGDRGPFGLGLRGEPGDRQV